MSPRQLISSIALSALFATSVSSARVDLTGTVRDAEGRPIAGATVYLYTAGPRTGVSTFCPSCYPDCGKHRESDSHGRFSITALSDSLLFRVLVVADGFEPTFANRVDPAGGPLELSPPRRDPARASAPATLHGRVVDPAGAPVVGAIVSPTGSRRGDRTMFGGLTATDPLAVTDAHGEFTLASRDTVDAWFVRVRARGLAPKAFTEVAPGPPTPTLTLGYGATVTGRLLLGDRPVPGAVLGLVQADGSAESFTGADTIATDSLGRFAFANMPPEQDYAFYGVIESLRPWALRTILVTVGEDESTTVVPALRLERGHRLAGRVRSADGRPLPSGTRLGLGRNFAWDYTPLSIGPDGEFDLDGIPPETVRLTPSLRGYRLSAQTPGLGGQSGRSMRLTMLKDRPRVELWMEPVPSPAPNPTPSRPR